jgi:hypothetical protein
VAFADTEPKPYGRAFASEREPTLILLSLDELIPNLCGDMGDSWAVFPVVAQLQSHNVSIASG